MYEVTISVPNEQKRLLDGICKHINNYVCQVQGTQTTIQQKHRSYWGFACSDTFSYQMQCIVKKSVAKCLALDYKNIYVRRLLELDDANFHQNVLIDTMCAFDHKLDADMIANVVDASKDIFIDGYYHFRLSPFKRKWKRVVEMLLENPHILTDNTLILEFLQYLLQSADNKYNQISICLQDGNFLLYDTNGRVCQRNFVVNGSSAEVQAIVQAICLNAQKIKVYHTEEPSQDFYQMAKDLFDTQFVKVQ